MSTAERDSSELESQIILRLPEIPATELKDAIQNGAVNLKDRLRLKLDPDLRHGTLFFDNYILPCKLVDLPCIVESHKTIDRKNIYKTADICQMLLCMEEEEPEEEAKPQKKTNSLKVDKRYLFPHGVTPPLKCARKRRFRRTLKKKQYSDQPEIEKEVRRLLRTDYEAYYINWECIDDEQQDEKGREGGGTNKDVILMQGSKTNDEPPASDRLAEEQIFGEALSDSEADDDVMGGGDLDDESRISMDLDDSQSLQSDSIASSSQQGESSKSSFQATSFHDLFVSPSPTCASGLPSTTALPSKSPEKTHRASSSKQQGSGTPSPGVSTLSPADRGELQAQLNQLKNELTEISARRQIQETELATMDTQHVLRSRLETLLNKFINDQSEKERQIREVEAKLFSINN